MISYFRIFVLFLLFVVFGFLEGCFLFCFSCIACVPCRLRSEIGFFLCWHTFLSSLLFIPPFFKLPLLPLLAYSFPTRVHDGFSFPLCVHYGASVLPFFPPSVVLLLFFGRRRVPQKLLFCFVLIRSHSSSSGESKLYDATGHCENIEFFTYYHMHSRRQTDGWRPLTFFPLLH